MLKQQAVALLRKVGLVRFADEVRFLIDRQRKSGLNAEFRAKHKDVVFPPDRLLYEIISSVDYPAYHAGGQRWASRFYNAARRVIPEGEIVVAEWGCGVGRILRHMPSFPGVKGVIGTDYDPRMVEWCSANIPGATFLKNDLMPPLPIGDSSVDVVYCYSVFTHLSEPAHVAWAREMLRVIRPGGAFLFTTMSDGCRERLLPSEREDYDAGRLVVRSDSREGGRTYAAYESAAYVKKTLLQGFELVAHEPSPAGKVQQDLWVARVPSST